MSKSALTDLSSEKEPVAPIADGLIGLVNRLVESRICSALLLRSVCCLHLLLELSLILLLFLHSLFDVFRCSNDKVSWEVEADFLFYTLEEESVEELSCLVEVTLIPLVLNRLNFNA